ncbi:MAG: 3-hydroxyacyl-CoA dehydrogenase [Alcaligenaceae bacterium]|nr:3-hydroxyacyl-CoA dehydrogenase [Alcaligenaceae bacterium]
MSLGVEVSVHGVMTLTMNFKPVNSIATPLRTALMQALLQATSDSSIKAVVLTGTDQIFSAGADLNEFSSGNAFDYPSFHNNVLPFIYAMRKPVVAALNGKAMGGGLELALWCHARVAVLNAQIGLPETTLGLIPGAGGTQLLPRALGLEQATSLILSGAIKPAADFQNTALIQKIAPETELLETAHTLALELSERAHDLPHLGHNQVSHENAEGFLQFARAQTRMRKDFSPGMLVAIDAIALTLSQSLTEGARHEFELFRPLVGSPEARAIRHLFFAERQASKVPGLHKNTEPRPVKRTAVIGAGYMGQGIAQCLVQAGFDVTLFDTNPEAAKNSIEKLKALPQLGNARLFVASSLSDLSSSDLIIEAAVENMEIKQAIFRELDSIVLPHAILATNTSTLDIDVLATVTQRPENVLGLHFFGPAPVMRLIEVVRGAKTADEVLLTGVNLAKILRKVPVITGVCPGFVANRIYTRLMEQALNLVSQGYAPHVIDSAVERWGWRMGPFRTMDLIGLDVLVKARLPDSKPTPGDTLLDRLVATGSLGQKAGLGWYAYTAKGTPCNTNPAITSWIPRPETHMSALQIAERCMIAMINEGARVLDEGIALRASDIDLCFVLGYGFSRLKGGIMFQASEMGLAHIQQKLMHAFQDTGDTSWIPSPLLVRQVASSGTFLDL